MARTIKLILAVFLPKLAKLFRTSIFDANAFNFFNRMARQTMEKRRREGSVNQYSDFLSVVMAMSTGSGSELGENTEGVEGSGVKITDGHIAVNSMAFFLAGFDVTESWLSFATYRMALNPEMQEKVAQEIREAVQESGGNITYDALNKMNYLDMFMSEVLRLTSPTPRTERMVTKEYAIPDSDIVLKEGTIVVIPILGIHQDEKYYPDPEKFDPERFSNEAKAERPTFAYLPFGQGPRNCIGMRFAIVAAKAAMAQIVQSFEISPCAETYVPLQFESVSGVLKPAQGLKVSFKSRGA